ncbi:nonsense-mediated mRNA decay protein [Histoplasma capsulatum H143]|uniref:Nonsense-mediated mRNA decay protein n=1 Tax=Ajellomyces capsulatus (strain H143) TaxID=544712 RepID=C6HF02_AJECH|nr:nonsense-mediated mRNA decay protein [Histoplasma capsulatum H143]
MAPHSPKPSSAGVLPISPSATQRGSSNKPSPKPAAPQLKVLIRRLPPGLTAQEFVAVLGDEWKVGNGKIDWFRFKEGKVFKDPAKPSRPTRAYLRVTSIPLVDELSEKVRVSAFQDGRNTGRDPILLGPPSLEYAPYPRVPGSRVRKDGRQGTIDLDSDFITFLESLTNPVTKSVADIAADDTKEEKPTITPLIQFLKEKRANKGKETSSPARPSRHSEADGAPVHSNEDGSKRTSTKASKEAESTRKPALAKQAKGALQPSAVTGRNTSKSANRPVTPTTVTVSSVSKHNPTLASAQAAPHSTATQAFLKHANPSQGVTEELLVAGFATFGKVVKVEIDKKKGFGYVDFAEPGGLAKAIQASPVQIAQSQVVVLERKSGAAVAQARVNASNRPSQSTMGSAPRVVSGGGGQTPSRPTRRGNRGKGGSKETGVGGGNTGSNAGGGNKIGTSK